MALLTVVCTACKGDGVVPRKEDDPYYSFGFPTTCEQCNGVGKVSADVKVEETKSAFLDSGCG